MILFSLVFSGVSFANQEQYERCVQNEEHNLSISIGISWIGFTKTGDEGLEQEKKNIQTKCANKRLNQTIDYSLSSYWNSNYPDANFYSEWDYDAWSYYSKKSKELYDQGKLVEAIYELQESLKYLRPTGEVYAKTQDLIKLLNNQINKETELLLNTISNKYVEERDKGIKFYEQWEYQSAKKHLKKAKEIAQDYLKISDPLWWDDKGIKKESEHNLSLVEEKIQTKEKFETSMKEAKLSDIKEKLWKKESIISSLVIEIKKRDSQTQDKVKTIAKLFTQDKKEETRLIGAYLLLMLD